MHTLYFIYPKAPLMVRGVIIVGTTEKENSLPNASRHEVTFSSYRLDCEMHPNFREIFQAGVLESVK